MLVLLVFLLYSCSCSPTPPVKPETELIAIPRQLNTNLFAQFLTSFPFYLTTPIQNLIAWFWSKVIYALIWIIIAVAAFKFFTRRKIKKVRSKKNPNQANRQPAGPPSLISTLANMDQKTLMSCASCPLLLHLMQGMDGMGGMPYMQQPVSYIQPAAMPVIPALPDVPFPELPPPFPDEEELPKEDLTSPDNLPPSIPEIKIPKRVYIKTPPVELPPQQSLPPAEEFYPQPQQFGGKQEYYPPESDTMERKPEPEPLPQPEAPQIQSFSQYPENFQKQDYYSPKRNMKIPKPDYIPPAFMLRPPYIKKTTGVF